MLDFFNNDEPPEGEISLSACLEQIEEEINDTWQIVQEEAECDFEDADINKMKKLLEDLTKLEQRRDDVLEVMEMRERMMG